MMNQYNKFEIKLARILTYWPWLKKVLKKSYQILNYILYKKEYRYNCLYDIFPFEYKDYETFFGYYDKSPINKSGDWAIFHASSQPTSKPPNPKYPIKIILFNLINQKVITEYESKSYNWQQGCRTHWIDNYRFIFNDFDQINEKFICKIINTKSQSLEKIIDFPIYDVKNDIGLSLNFQRLARLRPDYGYTNIKKKFDLNNIDDDGIFKINLKINEIKLLLSLKDIIVFGNTPIKNKIHHKINHIMINPQGNKFVFLHRYFNNNRKFDRLFICDINGNSLNLLSDKGIISHYFWQNSNILVCYMYDSSYGENFYKINVNNKNISILKSFETENFSDGHPNIFGNHMVFDSYPDRARMHKLYLYNFMNNSVRKIGEFLEPFRFSQENRCDLHPRWSCDGKKIFFDSVHTGKRKLYMLNLEENEQNSGYITYLQK